MVRNFEPRIDAINDLTPYADIRINKGDPVDFDMTALLGGGYSTADTDSLTLALGGDSEMDEASKALVAAEVNRMRDERLGGPAENHANPIAKAAVAETLRR